MQEEDRQLLRLTHRGDDRAARELWSRLGGLLRAYARSVAPHAADDIVQRALCRMMERKPPEIAAVVDVRAWLITLTRHEAISLKRSERRERARTQERLAPTGDLRGEQADEAAAALAALPRVLREVVTLRHASGMTFEQIAEALNVNRHTVAWRYARGIDRLKRAFEVGGMVDEKKVAHASR
jgi:RNA polymerase sigma-70 factor (ECF subfamily)